MKGSGPSPPEVGQPAPSSLFLELIVRPVWKVALSNALVLEVTERASERPGEAREASDGRNLALASVGKALRSAKRDPRQSSIDLDRVVRPDLDEVVRMGRKAASRKALVELYKSP